MNTNLSHAIGDYVPISGGTVTGDLTVNGTFTFAGAVAGGDQSWTNVGDMTFAAGSIIASGSTNGNTLIMRANDTAFITFTTGATDVCTLAGVTLSGTILASGTVIMPGFNINGNITGTSATFQINRDIHTDLAIFNGGTDDLYSAYWTLYGKNHATLPGYAELRVPNAAKTGRLMVMQVSGATDTPVITWLAAATHTNLNITSGQVLSVGGTQVVGARVIDARADDVVDTTYGAEEAGVLDALRDAMIAHGLIAAA